MTKPCVVCGGENTRPRSEACGVACSSRRWRERSPENAERNRVMNRDRARQNPEANRARAREWNRANPKRGSERARQWKRDNPERVREHQRKGDAKRRAMKAGAFSDGTWPDSPPQSQCQFCGSEVDLQRDHIVPLKRNGDDTLANCQTLCGHCNGSKHDKLEADLGPDFWLKVAARIVQRWAA